MSQSGHSNTGLEVVTFDSSWQARPEGEAIVGQIMDADRAAFGVYATEEEYTNALLQGGFILAAIDRTEDGQPLLASKVGMIMNGGLGDLAVSVWESNLPEGVAHHEGNVTLPNYRRRGLQLDLIGRAERLAQSRGARALTVALDPTNVTSARNYRRRGYAAVAFDRQYLMPPDKETQRYPALIAQKIQAGRLLFGSMMFRSADKTVRLSFDPRGSADPEPFYENIADVMAEGYVAVNVDYVLNENEREIDGSSEISFVPLDVLALEQQDAISKMRAELHARHFDASA